MPTGAIEVARIRKALAAHYRVERVLGEGGMATVYVAEDVKHHRKVAVKVMRPELAATLGADRFLREIEIAAQLTHPHILPVHDSGDSDGVLWYVMPLVEGGTLRDRLQRERQLPVDVALRLAREVAEGLGHAHRRGIVHRDIKPANIMLGEGHALVADFGIARAADSANALTQTGLAVGTPQYMSPEQAMGEAAVDARSDVYAIGAVLYEMLAGTPPFAGPTPQAVLAKSLTQDAAPIAGVRPGLPKEVIDVVSKAMARDPGNRYATGAELEAAMAVAQDAVRASTLTAARPASPNRRTMVGIGAAVGLAAVVLLGFVVMRDRDAAPADATMRLAVLPFENRGDSADAYFADGVTEALRGKLSAVPGMRVTARASSEQYRQTSKTPQQIANELGVRYLLTGTVRWQQAGNADRVQVNPELVDATTGDVQWQQSFDAALTDVFQVQAQVAGEVASALHIALGVQDRERLAQKPTNNPAAYDAYLRGDAITARSSAPTNALRAMAEFERAIALDSGFALAWAQLSRANSGVYGSSNPDPSLARAALHAAETALRLAPNLPEAYQVMALYHTTVTQLPDEAEAYVTQGLKLAPNNIGLRRSAAALKQRRGDWAGARADFLDVRVLDPRSQGVMLTLGTIHMALREFDAARGMFDQALALAPANSNFIQRRAMVELAAGDLPAARRIIAERIAAANREELIEFMASYWDLYWVLTDEQQKELLSLAPEKFGNTGLRLVDFAEVYAQRGDMARSRVYGDSAAAEWLRMERADPENRDTPFLRAVALAYAGRLEEAVRVVDAAYKRTPFELDQSEVGAYNVIQVIRVYIMAGKHDEALDRLEFLLGKPGFYSPGWVRVDPAFAPLKGNPRFERLSRSQ